MLAFKMINLGWLKLAFLLALCCKNFFVQPEFSHPKGFNHQAAYITSKHYGKFASNLWLIE